MGFGIQQGVRTILDCALYLIKYGKLQFSPEKNIFLHSWIKVIFIRVFIFRQFAFVQEHSWLNYCLHDQRCKSHQIERPIYFKIFIEIFRRHLSQAKIKHHRIFSGVVVCNQLTHSAETYKYATLSVM